MKTLFVVCTNDYPESVWSDEAKAEAYAEEQNKKQRDDPSRHPYMTPRIYYHVKQAEDRT